MGHSPGNGVQLADGSGTRIPSVLVLGVTDDGRILYTRKHGWREGVWGLVAGIVESGETAEEAVLREVFEESRMRALDPTYVCSFHLKNQLLLCFQVRLLGDHATAGSDADAVMLAEPAPERIPEGVPARWLLERYLNGRRFR